MALPRLSCLIVLVLALVTAGPGIAFKLEPSNTRGHFPPLLDCAPAPAAHSKNNSAFSANVLSLLASLPFAAAAAPTGFAAMRSSGAGNDRASARGSSPGNCRACLSAAAQDVIAGGCGGSRRAGCLLSYADTNASTTGEDAFRGWFYDDSDGDTTSALGSRCAGDRAAAAECSRCLDESARVVPALKEGNQLSRIHGDAVALVGYACYVRVQLVAPLPRWQQYE